METKTQNVCLRCHRPLDDHQWFAVIRGGDGWPTDQIVIDPPKCPKVPA